MTLTLRQVTKRFPRRPTSVVTTVLDRVTAETVPGITVLVGTNGVGKTTLIRLLAGLIRPDEGEVLWRGMPVEQTPIRYRRRLGYLPQRQATYPEMELGALLDYLAALKAIPPTLAAPRRDELLAALELAHAIHTPMTQLSQGARQLAGIAQALLNDPDVLLLDEPLEGLDHEARGLVMRLLPRAGRITVLATHRYEWALPYANAVWELRGGQIFAQPLNGAHPQLVEGW